MCQAAKEAVLDHGTPRGPRYRPKDAPHSFGDRQGAIRTCVQNPVFHHALNISIININIQNHFTPGLVEAGIIIANYIPSLGHSMPRSQGMMGVY